MTKWKTLVDIDLNLLVESVSLELIEKKNGRIDQTRDLFPLRDWIQCVGDVDAQAFVAVGSHTFEQKKKF